LRRYLRACVTADADGLLSCHASRYQWDNCASLVA